MHIRIAYKEHLFDIIEACDINSYKNRELAEIQCKEVQKKMNRVSRDLDLCLFLKIRLFQEYIKREILAKNYHCFTQWSVLLNFSLLTRGLLSESNDKETLDDIKYTLVIFMSTSTEAICQPKTLYESITLYVSIIPRAKTFIRQIHT